MKESLPHGEEIMQPRPHPVELPLRFEAVQSRCLRAGSFGLVVGRTFVSICFALAYGANWRKFSLT